MLEVGYIMSDTEVNTDWMKVVDEDSVAIDYTAIDYYWQSDLWESEKADAPGGYIDEDREASVRQFAMTPVDGPSKAFDPQQPRYPKGHPKAGMWRPDGVAESDYDEPVWNGEQHLKQDGTDSPKRTDYGARGEQLAIRVMNSLFGENFTELNIVGNNSPIDIGSKNHLVEVKTGLATNGKTAQHWRATIGEPGKEEKAFIKQMDKKQKKTHHAYKQQAILERKNAFVQDFEITYGHKFNGGTVGVIMTQDVQKADVFYFPDFHGRISWHNKELLSGGYVGTYKVS